MLATVTRLAAVDTAGHNGLGILCTILLIATIIAFIVGLAEVLGVYSLGGTRVGGSRFSALVVAVILLVIYIVLC